MKTNSKTPVIGVMGPGAASDEDCELAKQLGESIAQRGWVTLSGGRAAGVMDAVNQGAKSAGGLTVGIVPDKQASDTFQVSSAVDVVIETGMGSARNVINVLSSSVVVACGIPGNGTISEIALALKENKPVVLLRSSSETVDLFSSHPLVSVAETADEAIKICAASIAG